MIVLIWAMDQNRLIGKNQALPWHIKDDLAFFKSITHDKHVLMGMQTYLSMKTYFKDKKFPYPKVYVLSRSVSQLEDAVVISNIDTFLMSTNEEIYVLGGSQVYNLLLPKADVLYITYVLNTFEGDTYFPKYDLSQFKCVWFETKPGIILSKYERIPS